MSGDDLTREQSEALAATVARQLRFYTRLIDRMDARRWDPTDPLYVAAVEARNAVQGLLVLARYAGMESGVGRPAKGQK